MLTISLEGIPTAGKSTLLNELREEFVTFPAIPELQGWQNLPPYPTTADEIADNHDHMKQMEQIRLRTLDTETDVLIVDTSAIGTILFEHLMDQIYDWGGMEQVVDDYAALAKAGSILRPDGVVFLDPGSYDVVRDRWDQRRQRGLDRMESQDISQERLDELLSPADDFWTDRSIYREVEGLYSQFADLLTSVTVDTTQPVAAEAKTVADFVADLQSTTAPPVSRPLETLRDNWADVEPTADLGADQRQHFVDLLN